MIQDEETVKGGGQEEDTGRSRGLGAHQHLLKDVDALIGHRDAVDLPYLVAHVQRRLAVDHAAMHDTGDDAAALLVHLERDALQRGDTKGLGRH